MSTKLSVWTSDGGRPTIKIVREIYPEEYKVYRQSADRIMDWWNEAQAANAVRDAHENYLTALESYRQQYANRTLTDGTKAHRDLENLISNFLRAVRAFLDYSKKHLSDRYGKTSSEVRAFENVTHEEYDTHFSYRLMDQVRNYTQHVGGAVHHLPMGARGAKGNPKAKETEYYMTVELDRDKFLAWPKLKASVRKEVEQSTPRIDLTQHINNVMKSIDRIRTTVIAAQVFEIQRHARAVKTFAISAKGYGDKPFIHHWDPPEDAKVGEEFHLEMQTEQIPEELANFILQIPPDSA